MIRTLLQIHEPGQTPEPHTRKVPDSLTVGIDLGTTQSLIGRMDGDALLLAPDRHGAPTHPSVVRYLPDGSWVAGYAALGGVRDGSHAPLIRSIKRWMGRTSDEMRQVSDQPAWLVLEHEAPMVSGGDGKLHSPIEVSAAILRHLREAGEAAWGRPVGRAVITVPAYFDDNARQATRLAAQGAGLEVLRLVSEPTAAAIAYGLDRSDRRGYFMVYDFGGGTFDVSVLLLEDGLFHVQSVAGDDRLGGDDLDYALLCALYTEEERSCWSSSVAEARRRMVRFAKEALASSDEPILLPGASEGEEARPLTREVLAAAARPLVARTLAHCREALASGMVLASDVEAILLVGGSSRLPWVRDGLLEAFPGVVLCDSLSPETVVVAGAAAHAEALVSGQGDHLLLDITPLSLGLETLGGAVEVLIPRHTSLPTNTTMGFTTSEDNQGDLVLSVVQGERQLASENRLLGHIIFEGIPPMRAGTPQIDVTFAVDADGILTVSATEVSTGHAQSLTVVPTLGLDREAMTSMLMDYVTHAEEDERWRAWLEQSQEAEKTIRWLRLEVAETSKARAWAMASVLEQALASGEVGAVKKALEEQQAAITELAEERLAESLRGAMEGRSLDELASWTRGA
jgi:molecular chaperone HscA